ncbi:MAG: hypothetical protein IPI95_14785 [Flavobacteriales bacterium]|nr:hypothetical protein [Flavobacteriales bacterium]
MAILVHVLVNNKYLGYFVFIILFVLNIFGWQALDISSNLLKLNTTSGLTYSDMNGFGPFLKGWGGVKSYWLLFAVLVITNRTSTWCVATTRHGAGGSAKRWAGSNVRGRWPRCSEAGGW